MENNDMVRASDFCIHHNIELSFIHSLIDRNMIETIKADETIMVPMSELKSLEKIVRFHFELDINLEGIETITHLLHQIDALQDQVLQLSIRLKGYEQ